MTALETLPKPAVLEEFSHDDITARQTTTLKNVWSNVRAAHPNVDLPEYDVEMLDTDPAMISNQAESFREILLRARINQVARSRLLAFAEKSDLDHLAAFYDVTRMAGENDERLKKRVILAIQGRSPGGTEARYKFITMSADIRVEDAIVYTVGKSPVINVAIFSSDVNGVADAALIATVDAALQDPSKRMVNDTIIVRTAVRTIVNISASIWLLPDASLTLLETMKTNLQTEWAAVRALGRDLAVTWWTSKLMLEGVQKIVPVTPIEDVIVSADEAVSIGTITLDFKGRSF
ncbi:MULTISPECIES: baseplate J/gp47 family protein [unclassified Rhizobium]|uniref:baseplate J/gp47 family protein n=1 Tax=unclassified Rhizobium TaxID=2613769 RepID=UPI00288AB6B3|nr:MULTISPECIES: baseplate J/gp47 family protein [unclassified Rhizobium]